MPIINSIIANNESGSDKVTALVGSNASGISVGDKVILNYPAVNETGYCTEYRFQDQTYNSGQWSIFFDNYMMYVDTSGHPVILKHDIVNDKLIYLAKLDNTLDLLGADDNKNTALRITYNENTRRFATCKNGALKVYQLYINESKNYYNVELLFSLSSIYSFGGIAQDSDTICYLTTDMNLDSLVIKDFIVNDGVATLGEAYTHTNTAQSISSITSDAFGCFMSPGLSIFTFTNGNTSAAGGWITGAIVNKENKSITYSSETLTLSTINDGNSSNWSRHSEYWDMWVDDSGYAVLMDCYTNSSSILRSQGIQITTSTISLIGSIIANTNFGSEVLYANWAKYYFGKQQGIIHKINGWITGGPFAVSINETDGSYGRTPIASNNLSINSSYNGGAFCSSLSNTGLFIYPYRLATNSSTSYNTYIAKWNNGDPIRTYSYITPSDSISYPFYFDGNFLYATGGVFTASDSTLRKIGNLNVSGVLYNQGWMPPIFLDGRIGLGAGCSNNYYSTMAFLKDGTVSGALNETSALTSSSRQLYALDARLDSTNTGFVTFIRYNENYYANGGSEIAYYSNGSEITSCTSRYATAGFFSANGTCYRIGSSVLYSYTMSGSSMQEATVFNTNIMASMIGSLNDRYVTCWLAVQGDRVDDYQAWYTAGGSFHGFTKLDLTNSQMIQITTPSALQEISGTIYACWWDSQNRLNIRTNIGLYVFSYSNHDISTMQLVKKFEWSTDYSGPATCSSDLMSYAVGNATYIKVVREVDMPIYEFSANVYNGHNFAGTSLTGFVNEAISTDPWGQSIVEVNTVKDPADTWTNVGTPFGFDVSTTSANVSVGRGYYNSGSAEVIIPSTVTKTLSQASSGQTTGFKNDVVVYHDTLDNNSALMCKTGTTPVGTFKVSTALTTPVYLSPDKTVIVGTDADSGFDVSYAAADTLNCTKVGSPTISSAYVASGFSDSNYLTCANYLNSASQSFELVTAVNMSTASSTNLGIFDTSGTSTHNIRLTTSSTNTAHLRISTSGGETYAVDITGTTPLTVGTKVYIKATYSSSTGYALYTSTDGSTWTTEGTSSTTTRPYASANANLMIGDNSATGSSLSGSIYLADSYIKVNGNLMWIGAVIDGSVTVSEGYSYIDETEAPYYLGSDLTRSATQMVVHPEDFVEQETILPCFTVVGSPTISDGIMTNGSPSNYLLTDEPFNPGDNVWEATAKFTTGSSLQVIQVFNNPTDQRCFRVFIDNNKFGFLVSNGSRWINTSSYQGTYTPQTNTTYWIKAGYDGSNYYLKYSLDGETYTTDVSYSSSTKIGGGYYSAIGTATNNNSLDLNEVSISIGGSLWWSAYKSETSKQGTLFLTQPTAGTTSSVVVANTAAVPATNNYTVTGSTTITDGVASGFSSGNYLTAQQSTLYQYGDSWEFNTAFMVTSAYSSGDISYIIGNNSAGYSNLEIYLYQDGSNLTYNIMLRQGAYGTQCFGGARGNTILDLNTKYYLKVIYIHNDDSSKRVLRLEISTDGINYTHDNEGATYSWNYGPSQNRALVMGANLWPSQNYYFTNGSIYLADTNLYINGQLSWQAISPAQPSGPINTSKEYCGSVVNPINKGKVVTMDTTLTKILFVEDIL